MKKINQKGFVLAETLVVAVFLMAIFTLIFTNFYPLMGEYEKRETYDDVDGKYAVYWLKRLIEDSSYQISGNSDAFFKEKGYVRFECSDIVEDVGKKEMCKTLVKSLEVKGCTSNGDHCEIYITKYQIGSTTKSFKDSVSPTNASNNIKRYQVNNGNLSSYIQTCKDSLKESDETKKNTICTNEANSNEFRSGFKDYVESLPDYKVASLDGSKYRVIACFQHKKDNNNYYSYATIEVSR